MRMGVRSRRGPVRGWLAFALVFTLVAEAEPQVLIDRVLARVGSVPITLSAVRAGLGMGLIVAPDDDLPLATEQLVQRTLLQLEVERFPPPEPEVAAIAQEEARIRARIGPSLPTLMARTGLEEREIGQAARDTLRIRAYLDQRFGVTVQVSDEEARAYYSAHPEEFARDGVLVPFEQVEATVRQLASAARRQGTIDDWMADLRQRSDVVVNRQ